MALKVDTFKRDVIGIYRTGTLMIHYLLCDMNKKEAKEFALEVKLIVEKLSTQLDSVIGEKNE